MVEAQSLQQALLELTAILDNAAVGIAFTRDRRIERCNQRLAEIFGYESPQALAGQPAALLLPDAASYERLGVEAGPRLAAGQAFHTDLLMRRADGGTIWCNVYGRAVDPRHTESGGTVWVIDDVSEMRRTSAKLTQTAREMEAIMANAPVGVIFTRDRRIVRCNAKFSEMFRFASDSAVGAPGRAIYRSDEDYAALGHIAAPLLSQGKPFQTELLMRRQDGSDVWINLIGYVQDVDNPRDGTIWILEDVTRQRQMADALRQTLRETEAIMANASVAILFTRERRIVRANQRFAEMFGYPLEDLLGQPARVLYRSDEEYAELGRSAGPLLERAEPFRTELYLRRRDGSDLWINLFAYVQNRDNPLEGTIWIAEDRTDIKRAEQALQRAHAEAKIILDHCVVGIAFIKDRKILRCNQRAEELYGYPPGGLEGQPTRVMFLTDESYEYVGRTGYEALARGESFTYETLHRKRNGDPFWVRVTGRAIDPADPSAGSIWNTEDTGASKMAEGSLRESETLQRAILGSATLIILSTEPGGRIVSCNAAAERLLGLPASKILGRLPTELCFDAEELARHRERLREELGIVAEDAMSTLLARAQLGEIEGGEWTLRRADGVRFPVELSISPLRERIGDAAGQIKGYLMVAGDITERKRAESLLESEAVQRRRAEQRLKYLALHDSLTGLPNRQLARERIAQAVQQLAGRGQAGALLVVDLDRFKNINDALGHSLGDALLKQVATRLSAAVRVGDIVARLGGDEFVIVAPSLELPEHALVIAEKVREALRPGFALGGHELFVTPSIGVALAPRDGHDADTLLRRADAAMYQAKAAGRNAVRVYDPAMSEASELTLKTESGLRRAIERGEFEAHYQPVVSLADGSLVGLELLVRWRHPELGLVLPSKFIPIAEETGLVAPIGALVLEAACRDLRRWTERGIAVPKLAINLSALQFRERSMIDALAEVMSAQHIAPSQIELEITETALMHDGEKTLATLSWLADAGFELVVDDFGTGYSSLAYLKRFPVSKLKIDRSFICDMDHDPDDEAIVQTIIALARALRLRTTAEGVETAAQRDALRRFGCDFAQGYLFARPMPAAALEDRLLGRVHDATGT